ncbi:hypothetical protein [Oceanicoccus sagamiensis]|uniref:Phytanoyl-CoA dioxygenase n=1 Tax=Oceanicoccus sagamiensis TaxID=716816 RepID=A0A1X9NCD7_9GAMM|nr:hypothetical protein [Oceanicoccus sagamiensis]ARN74092.1 hypothetical protein BST96_08130 [Oceanicoccus sagamiensis]
MLLFYHRNILRLKRYIKIAKNLSDYKQRQLDLDPAGYAPFQQQVSKLLKDGYTSFNVEKTVTNALIAACRERFDSLDESDMVAQEGKKFYKDSISSPDYRPSTPFMQYALDEDILNTVGGYLGSTPFLQSIELIYSTPRDEGEALHQTHLYHKDKIDRRIVKMFTYITDVDDECGPFTVLPRKVTNAAPWYIEIPHYVTDETLSNFLNLDDAASFKSPAGSAMMADAKNLYHFGSRCIRPRLTFVAHYNSGYSLFPRNQVYKTWQGKAEVEALSPLQRNAIGI